MPTSSRVRNEPVLPSSTYANGVSHTENGVGNGHANGNGRAANGTTPSLNGDVAEFSGTSNDGIAEAVRKAIACASRALPTLDGAGLRVIPEVVPQTDANAPRFRVTLRVTAAPRPLTP